jgi:hypothetical protein
VSADSPALREQFAEEVKLRHCYERQLAGNVAWIQAGEYWLGQHRLLCEARSAVYPPEPPRPGLPALASSEVRLAYAQECNAYLWQLLEYQRAILQAQFEVAYKHGQAAWFAEHRLAQGKRVVDWLEYEPNAEGMAGETPAPPKMADTAVSPTEEQAGGAL